jgi:hypothetical protein
MRMSCLVGRDVRPSFHHPSIYYPQVTQVPISQVAAINYADIPI